MGTNPTSVLIAIKIRLLEPSKPRPGSDPYAVKFRPIKFFLGDYSFRKRFPPLTSEGSECPGSRVILPRRQRAY
jgi:hypothetical protein